jgi:hypothetical protein
MHLCLMFMNYKGNAVIKVIHGMNTKNPIPNSFFVTIKM